MAETSQVKFDLREVAIALIKHHSMHEGRWLIGFQFDLGAGNSGPTLTDVKPTAFVRITDILLTRTQEAEPNNLIVDAAAVNPPPKASSEPTHRKK